jgi:hypothetical protein
MSDLFRAAAQYAGLGWKVLRTHGLRDDGKTCGCWQGEKCGTPGKHPIDPGWQNVATNDEEVIAGWFEDGAKPNVSVKLGPDSGIIDVEWDDAAGKVTAERLGVTSVDTPTYVSSRSEHRLFRFDARLPEQAVIKISGLEVRTGGGKKGAQSVFPPSLHASGVRYRWKEGFSPEDVPVAEIPPALMSAIINDTGGELTKAPATAILHKVETAGGRHDALLRLSARMSINMLDPHDPQEQQDVLAMLRSINQTQCSPPKPDREVEDIWRSSLRWAIKVRAAGDRADKKEALEKYLDGPADGEVASEAAAAESSVGCPFTMTGLEFRDGEWWPGQWNLKVLHNDPVVFVLTIPVFEKRRTKFVDVTLDAETYRSAAKVAQRVLESTHTVILDGIPEEWGRIWSGQAAKPRLGQAAARGLKAKLMELAIEEDASAECLRYAEVAGWFLDVLAASPKPGDEEDGLGEPDASGRPAWVRKSTESPWELWFCWGVVWGIVERQHRTLIEGEKLRTRKLLLAVLGDPGLPAGRSKGYGGQAKRYIRFTDAHIRALEIISSGGLGESPLERARDGFSQLDFERGNAGKVVISPEVVS